MTQLRTPALSLFTSALLAMTACGGTEETNADGAASTADPSGVGGSGGSAAAPGAGASEGGSGNTDASGTAGGPAAVAGSAGVPAQGGAAAGGSENSAGGSPVNAGGAGGESGGGGNAAGGAPVVDGPDAECVAMVGAANAFIETLNDDLQNRATFPWDSNEHKKFEFLPPDFNNDTVRQGVPGNDLSEAQRATLDTFLNAAFSAQGMAKIAGIRQLEGTLSGDFRRDPLEYYISFFGEPNTEAAPWGFRFEGHHMSLHSSVVACKQYAATPAFWGASGYQNGQSPLKSEADLAQELFDSLGDLQDAAGANADGSNPSGDKDQPASPFQDVGASSADFNDAQKTALMNLIKAYTGNMSAPIAANRVKAVEDAGLDNIKFVYRNDGYYRLQGPTFIIEHAPQTGNHIHAIWRDFDGDWGADLIQRHMAEMHAGE